MSKPKDAAWAGWASITPIQRGGWLPGIAYSLDYMCCWDSVVHCQPNSIVRSQFVSKKGCPFKARLTWPSPPNRKNRDYYAAKLKEHNPTLANTYNQVWQAYYGTSSEPHRAALFMMRTLFDNFFAWLAPDEEVRNSPHWHKKAGEKPNQIWRSERLAYALEKNVDDDYRCNILKAEANQIGALYKAANKAHSRGALDEDKASRTLMAMDSFLKDWLDSLN